MNNLTSSTFSPEDLAYFRSNYLVVGSSVDSIDDAEFIMLGETHSVIDHKIKEMWLLNKLAKDNDILHLEHSNDLKRFTKYDFAENTGFLPNANLKYVSWDLPKARLSVHNKFKVYKNVLDNLRTYFSQIHSKPELILERIEKCLSWVNPEDHFKYVEKMGIPKKYHSPKDTQWLQNNYNALRTYAEEAKNLAGDDLKLLYLYILGLSTLLLFPSLVYMVESYCFDRDVSLAEKVTNSSGAQSENVSKWFIAGKTHLRYSENKDQPKKINDVLNNKLEGKKFVVLLPCKGNTTYAEAFLSPYKFSGMNKAIGYLINEFTIHHFSDWMINIGVCVGAIGTLAGVPLSIYPAALAFGGYIGRIYTGWKGEGSAWKEHVQFGQDCKKLIHDIKIQLTTYPAHLIERLDQIYDNHCPDEI